jgi:hypothetical protein
VKFDGVMDERVENFSGIGYCDDYGFFEDA